MMTADTLASLIRTAEDAGIAVISDEIYHGLDYAFAAQTAAKFSERAVIVNSFSKYFCMTGWRIGWMIAPECLVRPIERLHQNLAISAPTLSQIAAQAAFDGRAEMEQVKESYEENRRILLNGLPAIGLDRISPADGAFYLYVDVSPFTGDSAGLSKRLLEQAGVAVAPGTDFDPVNGYKYVRLCYAASTPDIAEAVARIGNWMGRGPAVQR
jgi:aspartate/methionine/tyrosine aminotransferase